MPYNRDNKDACIRGVMETMPASWHVHSNRKALKAALAKLNRQELGLLEEAMTDIAEDNYERGTADEKRRHALVLNSDLEQRAREAGRTRAEQVFHEHWMALTPEKQRAAVELLLKHITP